MFRRPVSVVIVAVLLTCIFSVVFNIRPVGAAGPFYILVDGSISPSSAPIQRNGNAYVLTGDITSNTNGIIVQKSNITIDGVGHTLDAVLDARLGNGFNLTGVNSVTVKNTRITNFNHGIYISDSSNDNVSGNNIANNEDGIYLVSSSNNIFSGNNMAANNAYGIIAKSSSNNAFSGNNMTANGDSGIILDSSSNNTVSGNNIANNSWYGIAVSASSNNSFLDNVIKANNIYGMWLYFSCSNNTISGNNVTANKDAGVWLQSCSTNIFQGNNITASNDAGVWLQSCSNNIFRGNNITANNGYGIELEGSSINSFSGNKIAGNGDGMWLYSSSNNNTISGNNVTANNGNGIWLRSCSNNTVSANNITANKGAGIYLYLYSYNNTVSGNNVADNLRGIYLDLWSNSNIFTANSITASNSEGIYLHFSSDNVFSGNNIIANRDSGIYLDLSSNNNVFSGNNIIANDPYGIYFSNSSDNANNAIYHNNFLNNASQVHSFGTPNVWDDGYPSGGNYWSDFLIKYPNAAEIDGSGIWNTTYAIDTNNTDHYPLVNQVPTPLNSLVPSPPQHLISQPGPSAVYLSWNPPSYVGNSSIQEYKIYRSASASAETFLGSVNGTTTYYLDNTVSSDNLYYYYITAANSAGESPTSNEVKCSSGESVKGIENVVELGEVKTTGFDPFSIQQNFWIYGPSHIYWAQNIIIVWPLSSKMSGAFEIYDSSPGSLLPPLNKVVSWLFTISIPSSPLKSSVTLRSSIEDSHLVMKNDFTQYVWDQALNSDYYIDTFLRPEIVVVGNLVKQAVSFDFPSSGGANTYVRIGSSPGTWLPGFNTVIRSPAHASTAENATGLQWNTDGVFYYSAGWADQGLFFTPSYDAAVASPPSVPSPSSPPNPSNAIMMYLHCPANLSLFDTTGNHLGYNTTTGVIDQQIPDTLYSFSGDLQVIIFNPSGSYSLQVVGTGNGNFTLEVLWSNKTGTVTTLWNSSETITDGDVLNYTISTEGSPQVIPEFSSSLVLPLFMIVTLLAVITFHRRKHSAYSKR